MPLPTAVTGFNRDVLNPLLAHLSGLGPFAEIEHVGRRSGRAYRTPLMAFVDGDTVIIALTYGPDVDWLKNVEAAGGGVLRRGSRALTLGRPRRLGTDEGRRRVPAPVRAALPLIRCRDYVELPVLGGTEDGVSGR